MKVAIEASTSSTYMPAAPMAARCHLFGSIQESETLQYRQGVSTSIMTPISWHSPPKCLQRQAVAELVQHLGHPQRDRQPEGVVEVEELVELRQLRAEHVELHRHQRQRREPSNRQHRHGQGEKNQRT